MFFKDFYESFEKYFLANIAEKTYFVWTDDFTLSQEKNVNIIEKKCECFPLDFLLRFRMFMQKKDILSSYEYIYFFNSNAKFLQSVNHDLIPTSDDGYLIGCKWPGNRKPFNHPMFYPYERRRRSSAYIPPYGNNYTYFMGGLNGGRAKEYLLMIDTLANNVETDLNKNIIARVHDESHINNYLRAHKCKIITNEYCWPEEWGSSFYPKIIFQDKTKYHHYFNKNRDFSKIGKIKKSFNVLYNAFRWYLYC